MKLALRKTAASNATGLDRAACQVIKARLVSQYCHGAIAVDGHLYQAAPSYGLHTLRPDEWSPEKWELFDVNANADTVLELFNVYKGADYDWLSLLAFVGLRVRDASRFYCFEWCWLAMTGQTPTFRVTPEMLIALAYRNQRT